jgi:hypothetical protein
MNEILLPLIGIGDHTAAAAAALAGSAFLAFARNWKAGAILLAAVLLAGAAIGALKAVFIGCDLYLSDLSVRYPSGHAALSAATLGTVGILVVSQIASWRRFVVVAALVAIEACIATGLVAMGFHSLYETLIGLFVGGGAAALAYLLTLVLRPGPMRPLQVRGLVITVATVVALNNLAGMPTQDLAGWLGAQVQTQTSMCRLLPQISRGDAIAPVHIAPGGWKTRVGLV